MKTFILTVLATVIMNQTVRAQVQETTQPTGTTAQTEPAAPSAEVPDWEKPVVYDGPFIANKFYAGSTFAKFIAMSCYEQMQELFDLYEKKGYMEALQNTLYDRRNKGHFTAESLENVGQNIEFVDFAKQEYSSEHAAKVGLFQKCERRINKLK